jgi:hypothetical protein
MFGLCGVAGACSNAPKGLDLPSQGNVLGRGCIRKEPRASETWALGKIGQGEKAAIPALIETNEILATVGEYKRAAAN